MLADLSHTFFWENMVEANSYPGANLEPDSYPGGTINYYKD